MSRTVLAAAAAVLIGLAACGGGKGQSTNPAATRSKATAKPSRSTEKKKTTAKRDTTRQKNPLTNN
jgi:ABC-type glycerol-3-phosphate transport system substrate-binding protein